MSAYDREDLEAIRSLQELFGGRFKEDEVAILYAVNNHDKFETANYIFEANPADVTELIDSEKRAWEIVRKKRPKLPRNIVDRARSGKIATAIRMFACAKEQCDRFWWKRVPERKQVSHCAVCKTKYDAIPRSREWGWAEFICQRCGNKFGGFCHMEVSSPCYHCGYCVYPTQILPPKRGAGKLVNMHKHSCNCCIGYDQVGVVRCAHPTTRTAHGLPKVINPSVEHDSSGSTVATFLPQDDINNPHYHVMDEILEEPYID